MRARILLGGGVLGVLVLGCGDPAEPDTILYGQWGSTGDNSALLIGLSVGAELQFGCSSVAVARAVEVERDGTFAFSGHYDTSMAQINGSDRARVQGRRDGRIIHLSMDVVNDGLPASSYVLEEGVNPHFEDQPPTCPL
jgi:hypothetical protein